MQPQTLKGFRDFLPPVARRRQHVIATIQRAFERFGFDPLETPALEYAETLQGKYGEEADKLLYLFQDRGGRNVGMRYDQTVPTARVVAQYRHDLAFPFKRYQIQPVWRAENTQRGRFREFLQCDADIFGVDSYTADAEILALLGACLEALNINYTIKVNSREMLFSHLKGVISDDRWMDAIRSIDKLDKKSTEEVKQELNTKEFNKTQIEDIFSNMESAEAKDDARLGHVIQIATENFGLSKERVSFVPSLARGLDYYTGLIFEATAQDAGLGSIAGGGRYDSLIGMISGENIPAVGFALGFDRIMELVDLQNLPPTSTKVFVATFHDEEDKHGLNPHAFNLVRQLRDSGITSEINLETKLQIDKQYKYADKKGIPYVVIIGSQEIKNNTITIKELRTRVQKTVSISKGLSFLQNGQSLQDLESDK